MGQFLVLPQKARDSRRTGRGGGRLFHPRLHGQSPAGLHGRHGDADFLPRRSGRSPRKSHGAVREGPQRRRPRGRADFSLCAARRGKRVFRHSGPAGGGRRPDEVRGGRERGRERDFHHGRRDVPAGGGADGPLCLSGRRHPKKRRQRLRADARPDCTVPEARGRGRAAAEPEPFPAGFFRPGRRGGPGEGLRRREGAVPEADGRVPGGLLKRGRGGGENRKGPPRFSES